jgi:hypothetical protein
MNNEPVAWAMFKDNTFMDAIHPDEHTRFEGGYTIPLYTHPVKELTDEEKAKENLRKLNLALEAQELTDEEIKEVWMKRPVNTAEGVIEFARAILRKAQEK